MLQALLTFAAETAEEETSKTAFYVLGSVAAAWALILFSVGMRSPTFPGTPAVQRAVMGISALVVVAAMASAVLTA